jgi:nicotinamidase-related amidase
MKKLMKALILIDIQNDYFENGANPLVGSDIACLQAMKILQYFRKENSSIFHVKHISIRTGSTFFLNGSKGAEFHKNVMPLEGENVITKNFPNAFKETSLLK